MKRDSKTTKTKKVQRWRHALTQVANFSGWDSRGCHEADLIEEIVGKIWSDLCSKLPSYNDNLVGIDWRIAKMNSSLKMGLDDVRFVGIWGMGGIGKTTLARAVYKRFSTQFDSCCFLANVRETSEKEKDGQVQLQKKLISQLNSCSIEIWDTDHGKEIIEKLCFNKKILLVLDDVNHISQLENLAESPEWFGAGSRVIITTRDMHLLKSHGVHRLYQLEMMMKDESLLLFSKKAFKKDHPKEGYLELSEIVVQYSGGLPLVLKILGSFLCRRSIPQWNDALDRLKQTPNNDIHQILKISYDGLNTDEKTIFLDVACFFNRWDKNEVTKLLESLGLHPTIGLSVLVEKSLLMVKPYFAGGLQIEMHDLLQELGRSIASQESPCTRLWHLEGINEVLKSDMGTEALEVIQLPDMSMLVEFDEACWHPKALLKMHNLRLLIGSVQSRKLLFFDGLKKVFNATKIVYWTEYPLKTLPLEGSSDKLVEIHMPFCHIKQLWRGVQILGKLKLIDMRHSPHLTESPNFSEVPNLEILDLEGCESLVEIHPSLGELQKLVRVNLRHCKSLEILPRKLETNNLMELILGECPKVTRLLEFGENMKNLSLLDLKDTAITELPESLGFVTSLTHLNLACCVNFVGPHHSFHNWKLLRTLNMSCCKKIFGLPDLYEEEALENIEVISETCIKGHFSDSGNLRHIKGLQVLKSLSEVTELDLSHCFFNDVLILHRIGSCLSSSLVVLHLDGNEFFEPLAGSFSNLFRLRYLFLNFGCISSLPELPPCLIRLEVGFICGLMETLGDEEMWVLFSSLDHQRRCGTKYLGTRLTEIESKYHPCRDFVATINSTSKIPSWFPCRLNEKGKTISITVDIPHCCCYSEWSGIAVCLRITYSDYDGYLSWASKAPEDYNYVYKGWEHVIPSRRCLCILLLNSNDETCWKHIRGDKKQLQVQFSYSCRWGIIEECGWRVICKQEMQEWWCSHSKSNDEFNKFSVTDGFLKSEVWVSDSVVDRTLRFFHVPQTQ